MQGDREESAGAGFVPSAIAPYIFAALALVGLSLTRIHSYLLFHSLAEIFSVVVACGVFMVVWNARSFLHNEYLAFLGTAFLFVGIMDAIHALAYKGMGVFSGYGADLAIQLWIATRYVHAISFLLAGVFAKRRLNAHAVFACYALVTTVCLLVVFYWRVFPRCYSDQRGLTSFKIVSEYVICGIFALSALLLWQRRGLFDAHALQLLMVSLGFTIVSEFTFTLYRDVYGPFNMLGHLAKIVAFYLIYKAAIESSLVRPYSTMFRSLKEREEDLAVRELGFRRLVDESPGGILVVNRQGVVRYVNPAAQEALGRSAAELVGQPLGYELRPGEQGPFTIRRADGSAVTVRARVVETQWEGEPVYLACLHHVGTPEGC